MSKMTYDVAVDRYFYDGESLRWRNDLTKDAHPSAKMLAGRVVGCKDNLGYYVTAYKGKAYKVHRIVWLIVYGKWPNGIIDHINRDPSDNRIENLRDVGHSENQLNRKHSGRVDYPGVYVAKNGKYIANIKIQGNHKHLGTYETEADAISARKEAEAKYVPSRHLENVRRLCKNGDSN